jgi:hypothetical protein
LAKRNYFNGLVVGGVLGALLGAIYISRQDSNRIITKQSRQIGNNAKRVLRGISRKMLEMTRR